MAAEESDPVTGRGTKVLALSGELSQAHGGETFTGLSGRQLGHPEASSERH